MPIPKSLHTVRVLTIMGGMIYASEDDYGLIDRATKALEADDEA